MSNNETVDEDNEALNKLEVIEKNIKLLRKYGKVARLAIKKRDPFIPLSVEKEIREKVKKMKAITANDLAVKYDVRVSAIKKLLLKLEEEGELERISSSSRLTIFKPTK